MAFYCALVNAIFTAFTVIYDARLFVALQGLVQGRLAGPMAGVAVFGRSREAGCRELLN